MYLHTYVHMLCMEYAMCNCAKLVVVVLHLARTKAYCMLCTILLILIIDISWEIPLRCT